MGELLDQKIKFRKELFPPEYMSSFEEYYEFEVNDDAGILCAVNQ